MLESKISFQEVASFYYFTVSRPQKWYTNPEEFRPIRQIEHYVQKITESIR